MGRLSLEYLRVQFGILLGSFGDYVRTSLGSFWNNVGIILGSFVRSFWDYFETSLGSF